MMDPPNVLQLEPFVHQVGGHFPMICLDTVTVCKPLNSREHRFYESLPSHPQLVQFTPTFHGTMQVEAKEDKEGYIQLKGQPPPTYSKKPSGGGTTHFRLKRKESIEIGTVSEEELDESGNTSEHSSSEAPNPSSSEPVHRSASESSGSSTSNGQFYNPWALKCHRDHLKKLGLLGASASSSTIIQDDASKQDASSSEENSSMGDNTGTTVAVAKERKRSRSNPQMYLLLENLVSRYRHPCILDLKVGSRQYADYNSAAKKQRKIDKAKSTTLHSLKLRLGGMQVYNVRSGQYICRNKYYGRSLDDSGFHAALTEFLTNDTSVRLDVLRGLRQRVQLLESVLDALATFRFYTSSLLVTYDGSAASADGDDVVDVRIIDFAHSTHDGLGDPFKHEGPDEDFVQGLRNLVAILGEIERKAKVGN